MYSSRSYQFMLAMLIISPMVIVSTASAQEVLLRDDFDGSGMVNTDVWRLPFESEGTFVGRTQYRGDPTTDVPSQGIAEPLATDGLVSEIYLDTFSPVDPGNQFLGTDLISKRNFARGGGLAFEGRLRLAPSTNTGGVIGGFFTFDVTRETPPGTPVRDEIDFELLSNEIVTPAPQRILTNVFDEDGFAGPGSGGNPAFHNVGGLDLTQFQDYRVEWTPQSVRWFVNDSLVRVETEDVPDDPQKLHFNLWAPDSGFSEAFNAALQPALTEGANQRFTAQIDSVEVTRFNTTVSDNLITDGSFESISQPTPIQNVAATTTGQWLKFGNVNFVTAGSSDNVPPFGGDGVDGFQIATMFGPFNGGPDASGLLQNVVAQPGQEFEASVLSQTLSGDSIAGNENYTTVAISFLDSSGNVIEDAPFVATDGKDFPLLDGRDPNITQDEFVRGTVNAKAPAGTAYARLSLFFLQLNNEGGAAVFEDASLRLLTAVAPPIVPGDFNADGIVNAADYTVWRDNLGLDAAALNGAGSGGAVVVQADYALWSANYGSVGGTSSVAVPEPAGLAVMLVGSLAMVCRRQRRQA